MFFEIMDPCGRVSGHPAAEIERAMLQGIALLHCGRAGGQGIAGAEGTPCRLDRKSRVLDRHLGPEGFKNNL